MAARSIKAGSAFIELTANDNKLVRGLRRAQRKLRAFSASTRAAGMGMVKLAGLFALPFAVGAKVFANFQTQMANVSTMLDDPTVHMGKFRKEIRGMAVEFGESTEALAGGLFDILSASVPASKALDVLRVSAKAAKAGMTDTKIAADAITTVLNSYGLEAEHAADVSDFLFTIVKRGKTTFAELAPAIGNVSTIASQAGLSLNELGAMIALLTRSGIKTDIAMTNVKAVITQFLKPTAEAAQLAKKFGFEMSSTTLQTEGLVGVFKKLQGLPPDVLSKIFPNVRGLGAVLAGAGDLEGFQGDVAGMANRAGKTEIAFTKMAKTLKFSFEQIKQAGLDAFIEIGSAIAEPLAEVAVVIKVVLKRFRAWAKANKGLLPTILAVVAAVGAVGASLVILGIVLSSLGTVFGALAALVSFFLSPLGLVAAAILGVVFAVGTGTKALKGLGRLFGQLTGDVKAAGAGIRDALAVGDIAGAQKILWDTVKLAWKRGVNFILGLWDDFKTRLGDAADIPIFGIVSVLIDAGAQMDRVWLKIVQGLKLIWAGFMDSVRISWKWLTKLIPDAIAKKLGIDKKDKDAPLGVEKVAEDFKNKERKIEKERLARQKALIDLMAENSAKRKKQFTERQARRRKEIELEQQKHRISIKQAEERRNAPDRQRKAEEKARKAAEKAEAKEIKALKKDIGVMSLIRTQLINMSSFDQATVDEFARNIKKAMGRILELEVKGSQRKTRALDIKRAGEDALKRLQVPAPTAAAAAASTKQSALQAEIKALKEAISEISLERTRELNKPGAEPFQGDPLRLARDIFHGRERLRKLEAKARAGQVTVAKKAEAAKRKIGEGMDGVRTPEARAGDVAGTFNALAARSLGGNSADRTAVATEETAKHTKLILRNSKKPGLVF